ncbi:MAG: DUF393 domain-containing protein [Fimbriimonadaceae bacterium]|nr:DUF393 domain-containing protein [Fimbriimonadaceae bacterium]
MNEAPRPTLLYDGTCRFCIASVARLRRLVGDRFEAVPSGSAEAQQRYTQLGEAETERQMVLVVGDQWHGGAAALAELLRLHPLLRLLSPWYYLPGLRQAADWVYRQIARRRHCLGGACELPGVAAR